VARHDLIQESHTPAPCGAGKWKESRNAGNNGKAEKTLGILYS